MRVNIANTVLWILRVFKIDKHNSSIVLSQIRKSINIFALFLYNSLKCPFKERDPLCGSLHERLLYQSELNNK